MSKQRRLGRGIDALLQGRDLSQLEHDANSVITVPHDRIAPNPDQPRKHFDEESLGELARSIEERGIIQPILAEEQSDGTYMIIAGERRWRAAKLAGLTVIPVLPGVFSADEKLEIALIENIQRQNLSPLEEAKAYQDLLESIGFSQDELARRLGKSRPAIANSLRLLKLPEAVQDKVNSGALSAGHARTLLGLTGDALESIEAAADFTIEEGLSVRALERLVTMLNRGIALAEAGGLLAAHEPDTPQENPTESKSSAGRRADHHPTRAGTDPVARKSVELQRIEQKMIEALGTRVVVNGTDNKGRIEISYLSMEDLERVAEIIVGEEAFSS